MLTELINSILRQRKAQRQKKFHPLDGWRPLEGKLELPSLTDDMTRMYASYGAGLSPEFIAEVAGRISSYRALIALGDEQSLCGIIFALPSGSFLTTFHCGVDGQRRVSGYVMGDATLWECSIVASELIRVFEAAVLPPLAHAAEPLYK